MMAKRRRERFSREQKEWIAKARRAPSVYKAAGLKAKAIIEQFQYRHKPKV
jgi:hypothetical protein